jgi:hypothetical protein
VTSCEIRIAGSHAIRSVLFVLHELGLVHAGRRRHSSIHTDESMGGTVDRAS